MIRAILLFIVLGVGLFVGTQFAGQQGYVLISIAGKTIEMSVTTLVVLIIALLAVLFTLEYVIKKILSTSSRTWNWFSVRKVKRARRFTNEGMIKLIEGDWVAAEKKVTRWVNHHDMPLLCYLIASEAAQEMGDVAKRDRYLELADQQDSSGLAVKLTKARQQVRDQQFEPALEILNELKGRYPTNPIVLNLLKTVFTELGRWQSLLELLPKLHKNKLITKEEQQRISLEAHCGVMEEVAQKNGSDGLLAHWEKLPRKLKQETHLVTSFVHQLIKRKADDQAYVVVRDALKKSQDEQLISLLPEMNLGDTHPAILLLKKQLNRDPENAAAYSALAQFYMREENWSEAQENFEKALHLRANVSDYTYLADVLERQDMNQEAGNVSRQALTLVEAVK